MNQSTLEPFSLRREVLGKGDRIKAVSLFTKPQPLPSCQTVRGGTAWGGGHHHHPGPSALGLLLVSSFICTCMIESLGWDHTLPSQPVLSPSTELRMSTPTVNMWARMNEQMCICWLVIYFAFAVEQNLLYLKFWLLKQTKLRLWKCIILRLKSP